MTNSKLPDRASLEYLKKVAKERLRELRQTHPTTKLAAALLAVARDHGFPSWRALKAEVERQQATDAVRFLEACATGDMNAVRDALARDSSLARVTNPEAPHEGWTALHEATKAGHPAVVGLLLAHGADPNAREAGDNTYPLHWAVAARNLVIARALLDAGGDAIGAGDLHALDVIGWATVFGPSDDAPSSPELLSLLLDRGARHHIFSAIAVGDFALIRALVEEDPDALDRRRSRFEQGETALQFAIGRKRYDILDLLIELGADVEATDMRGRTAMDIAMLRGDRGAMKRLHAAGAREPARIAAPDLRAAMAKMSGSVRKGVIGVSVADIAATLDWYTSIGFTEVGRYADGGVVNWGMLAFGSVEVMLGLGGKPGRQGTSLWLYTDRVDEIYQLLKSRQLEAAHGVLAGQPTQGGIEFEEDIYNPFYGGRQFSIRDPNGYAVIFYQEGEP